ncbi:unnamed protein product [Blepharisma stoltei]|uniref:Protein kinase domain-containing protein n=1 Tax=Blepharisma stoltei TaxID=1481888 RepID=A0AAU9JNK8_9CILI|nr:unnamed protein product [Blepharisma stoltei]
MNSVFENIDSLAQGTCKFWITNVQNGENEIYNGHLYRVGKSKILEEGSYSLTSKFLIKSNQNTQKMVPLEWKVMEPFVEESRNAPRYGFRLGHIGHMKDFYVPDTKSLEIWIEKMSDLCIMTDIENDYYFIKPIGKGQSAQIFLAERANNNKQYAIKAITKIKLVENPDILRNLTNEIKIMRQCNHPNILKLHRVYESGTHIYLVLDYAEGGDLFTRIIKRKRFTEETILQLSYRLMSVLSYLDSLNIVHRDIKLENILMVSEGNDYDFKLADFGLSEEVIGSLYKKCGSPGYIAPEIITGIPYGTKVDLFSAGVVLFILLTGKMPFGGKTTRDILLRNKDCKIAFQESIWKNLTKNCLSFVSNLLQRDQNFRANARDLLNHPWFSENEFKLQETKDINSCAEEIRKKIKF